jgi:putative ABC transport system substrate-binding protein
MRELGYIEGRNLQVEYRWAHGQFERLPELAAELVRLNVDVIVTGVTAASLAAKAATQSIPIVMVAVGDPVGVGLVASLARPGGNITGTSTMNTEVVGKQLELLKDIDRNLSRVAVLWNPANSAYQALLLREAESAGRKLDLQLMLLEASGPNEFDATFAAIRRERVRALLVLADPVFSLHWDALVEGISKDRLLAVSGTREFAQAGGPLAHGPSFFAASKSAAPYVDKILKGAKPGDLPIEQSTKFELVVNLKAVKALDLTIPQSILVRADEVID